MRIVNRPTISSRAPTVHQFQIVRQEGSSLTPALIILLEIDLLHPDGRRHPALPRQTDHDGADRKL